MFASGALFGTVRIADPSAVAIRGQRSTICPSIDAVIHRWLYAPSFLLWHALTPPWGPSTVASPPAHERPSAVSGLDGGRGPIWRFTGPPSSWQRQWIRQSIEPMAALALSTWWPFSDARWSLRPRRAAAAVRRRRPPPQQLPAVGSAETASSPPRGGDDRRRSHGPCARAHGSGRPGGRAGVHATSVRPRRHAHQQPTLVFPCTVRWRRPGTGATAARDARASRWHGRTAAPRRACRCSRGHATARAAVSAARVAPPRDAVVAGRRRRAARRGG